MSDTNPKPKNLVIINAIGTVFLFINLLAGFWKIIPFIIILFGIIHTIVRLSYLKAEQKLQTINPEATQTTIAPPVIRNIASVITAFLTAVVLYYLGFGLRYLADMVF